MMADEVTRVVKKIFLLLLFLELNHFLTVGWHLDILALLPTIKCKKRGIKRFLFYFSHTGVSDPTSPSPFLIPF